MTDHPSSFPPPWSLQGQAYIVLFHATRDMAPVPPPLAGCFDHGTGALMLTDYEHSDVGPFRELSFIPGQFLTPWGRSRSMTRRWTTTEASRTSGAHHWGMPSQRASIDWSIDDDPKTITLRDGEQQATFQFHRPGDLAMPITSVLIPRRIRTLVQPSNHQSWLKFIPRASGRVSRANLLELDADRLIDGFSSVEVVSSWHVRGFKATFPAPLERPQVAAHGPHGGSTKPNRA